RESRRWMTPARSSTSVSMAFCCPTTAGASWTARPCRSTCCPPSRASFVAAVALGARFTLVGRAYLYGLMAGGEAGVDRAIEILSGQVTRTMRLLGVTSLHELKPQPGAHVARFRGGG